MDLSKFRLPVFWTKERNQKLIEFFSSERSQEEIQKFYEELVSLGYKGGLTHLIKKGKALSKAVNGQETLHSNNHKRIGRVIVHKPLKIKIRKVLSI